MNKKGLTLIELLGVIIVLGIIAAIAFPAIGSQIERSRKNGIAENANSMVASARTYAQELYIDGKPMREETTTASGDTQAITYVFVSLEDLKTSGILANHPGSFGVVKFVKNTNGNLVVVGVQYSEGSYHIEEVVEVGLGTLKGNPNVKDGAIVKENQWSIPDLSE